MKPTVPELLVGIADALTSDVAPHVEQLAARNQVAAAAAMLRRLAGLVPRLTPHLLTDAADIATTLATLAPTLDDPALRAAIDVACTALDALDPTVAGLDDIQRVHHDLLVVLDAVVSSFERDAPSTPAASALAALLERCVKRERDLGASIAGR
jgi:hypothetical protein